MTRPSRRVRQLTPINVDYQSEAGVDNGADGIDWDTGDYTPIIAEPEAEDHIADPDDAHDASAVSFAPAGGVSSTDVQAAIEELDADIAALSGSGYSPVSVTDDGGDHYYLLCDGDGTPVLVEV